MDWQTFASLAVVASAASYLGITAWRTLRRAGRCRGCHAGLARIRR